MTQTNQNIDGAPKITVKSSMSTERLLGGKHKAYIGYAWGIAKSEAKAKAKAEEMAVDILKNTESARIEIRNGYLIVSQVTSSDSAWYTIKKVSDLTKNETIYSCCSMSPVGLKAAIDSHLAQYMANEPKF